MSAATPRVSVRAVLSFMWLQTGWLACVLAAAHGRPWIGPIVVVVTLSAHVRKQRTKARELRILGISAIVGFLVDTAFLRFGVVRIRGTMLSPPWLMALWPNFISTTADDGLLRSLPSRPLFSSLLGAVGGPIAYDSGARLGAIGFDAHRIGKLAIIGLVWAAIVPALAAVRTRLAPFSSRRSRRAR